MYCVHESDVQSRNDKNKICWAIKWNGIRKNYIISVRKKTNIFRLKREREREAHVECQKRKAIARNCVYWFVSGGCIRKRSTEVKLGSEIVIFTALPLEDLNTNRRMNLSRSWNCFWDRLFYSWNEELYKIHPTSQLAISSVSEYWDWAFWVYCANSSLRDENKHKKKYVSKKCVSKATIGSNSINFVNWMKNKMKKKSLTRDSQL